MHDMLREVARVLETAAQVMEQRPGLDPDAAVRTAIWGTVPNVDVPDDTADGLLYDEAVMAIEGYDAERYGYDPEGIQHLPRHDAIEAARARAADLFRLCPPPQRER